jgi:hypothetical protein
MGLRRRTFPAWIAGLAAAIVGIPRALGWPSARRKLGRDEESTEPVDRAQATTPGDSSGIKITTIRRTTMARYSGQDFDRDPDVFYIQGEWRRWEPGRSSGGRANPDGTSQRVYGPRTAIIVRPDRGKMFELNLDASEYVARSYPPEKPRPLTKEQMEARGLKASTAAQSAKPTFRIETTTKDTGERKEIFGYVARHVITTRKEIPLEGSRRGAQESVTDAWYIDLQPQFRLGIYPPDWPNGKPAQGRRAHSYVSAASATDRSPQEVPEFIDIGEPETGFALEEIRTSRNSYTSPDGTKSQTEGKDETHVRLERAVYDSALFEVPAGFKRVSEIQRNPA